MGARFTKHRKRLIRPISTGKYSLVKNQSSAITALDKVYSVLVDCMEPDPVLDKLLEHGFPGTIVRQIREEQLTSGKNTKLLEAVRKRGKTEYQNLKSSLVQCGQEQICALLESTEKRENTSDLEREFREKLSEDYKHYKDLKEDLSTYYRENESHIPASPLVDEHDVAVEDLYVLPTMWTYEEPYNFGRGKNKQKRDKTSGSDDQEKQKITISQLFASGGVRYKKIYITANAGFGKTSLSKKLTMTCCQSHLPLKSLKKKYKGKELDAIKFFDLVFLLHLRDYQSCPKCNIDDLIMKMVSENMSRKSQYTNEFIERILHDKKV